MGPTGGLQNGPGTSPLGIEGVITAIGMGLENPGISLEVLGRMLAASVFRIVEHRRWRNDPAIGPIISAIDPDPARIGLALG